MTHASERHRDFLTHSAHQPMKILRGAALATLLALGEAADTFAVAVFSTAFVTVYAAVVASVPTFAFTDGFITVPAT